MPKGIFIRSEEHKRHIGESQMGEKHHAWKGNKVGYKGVHDWIGRNFGKPKFCEHCGTKNAKKFEWANISQKYKRDRVDWLRLCTSCHRNYDNSRKVFLSNMI